MWIKTMPQVGIPRIRKQGILNYFKTFHRKTSSNGNTAHCQQNLMVRFLKQQIFRSFHVNEILMLVYMYVQIMENK